MKFNDAVIGVFFVAFAIAQITYAQLTFPPLRGQEFDSRDFPTLIGVGMIVCGVLLIVKGLKTRATGHLVGAAFFSVGDWMSSNRIALNFLSVVLGIILFITFLNVAGFVLTSFVLLVVLFLRFANSLVVSLISAALSTAMVYIVFGTLLRVPLPSGILGI